MTKNKNKPSTYWVYYVPDINLIDFYFIDSLIILIL